MYMLLRFKILFKKKKESYYHYKFTVIFFLSWDRMYSVIVD